MTTLALLLATAATAHCHIIGHDVAVRPDPACTPGAIVAPACTHRTRPDTRNLKTQILAAYGIPESQRGDYELDHLIPFALGGATSAANLWPERNYPQAMRRPFILNPKDRLEQYVYRRVCLQHTMRVTTARNLMRTDWVSAYLRYTKDD